MHECFGATIVLGTPLISSLLYIIKLLVLFLRLSENNCCILRLVFFLQNICGYRHGTLVRMGLKGVKEV